MFEVDLGKVKFQWKGTYDASTTYEKDDVVYHSGSSWVYINSTDVAGQTPSDSNTTYWNKMAQGSDLGAVSGLNAGDMIYYDGTNFQRVDNGENTHEVLVQRASGPIFKPQGLIQLRYAKVGGTGTASGTGTPPQLARTSSHSANTFGPFNEGYDGANWTSNTSIFQPEITPKFSTSFLKVDLNAQVSIQNNTSIHVQYRIMKSSDGGQNWYRPDALRFSWGEAQTAPMGEWGMYQFTSNGATYVYQVAPCQFSFIDEECVAGTTYRYRLEGNSQTASIRHYMNFDDASNQTYGRSGSSYFMVAEINNGD